MSGSIDTDVVIIVVTILDSHSCLGPLFEGSAGLVLVLDLYLLAWEEAGERLGVSVQLDSLLHDTLGVGFVSDISSLPPFLSGAELTRLEWQKVAKNTLPKIIWAGLRPMIGQGVLRCWRMARVILSVLSEPV